MFRIRLSNNIMLHKERSDYTGFLIMGINYDYKEYLSFGLRIRFYLKSKRKAGYEIKMGNENYKWMEPVTVIEL